MCGARITPQTPAGGLAGRFLELRLHAGDEYPMRPPTVHFISRVNLPCVDASGNVVAARVPYMAAWDPKKTLTGCLAALQQICAAAPGGQPPEGTRF